MIIIDGSHLAYRSFHVFNNFANSKGEHTGMVYGFMNIITSYARNFNDGFIICWDKRPYWREELYPAYKKPRYEKEKDENISPSFNRLKQVCNLAGFLQLEIQGFESDDLISFLTKRIGSNIKIITGDKDLMQLVSDKNNIKILRPHPKLGLVTYDEAEVYNEYKVYTTDMPLYLAIRGDKSDNIIGIKGLGEVKTAALFKNLGTSQRVLDMIKITYPTDYDRILLNLELTDLVNSKKSIMNLEESNFISYKPDVVELNKVFHQLEFTSIFAKEVINDTYSENWSIAVKNILLEKITTRFHGG